MARGWRSRTPERDLGPSWDERSALAESIRVLRSNLTVALADLPQPTVVVTSASASEGKTLTCGSLAMSFAEAGQRVVLVDLDLRHPNAHAFVGAHNEYGVADVLLGRRSLDSCLQYVELGSPLLRQRPGLYFLATGPAVSNPTELLGSGRTARLLEALAGQADLILIDTPPVLPVADTLVIGRIASGALLVAEARKTDVAAVVTAKDLLTRNQTRLLGVVLNKFRQRDAGYGYGYGYGAPPTDHGGATGSAFPDDVAAGGGSADPAGDLEEPDTAYGAHRIRNGSAANGTSS